MRVAQPTFTALALAAACVVTAAAAELGHPGYLVVAGAADSTAAFSWRSGPGPGQRTLVWEQGLLTLPDSLEVEAFGPHDLAVAVAAALTGTSEGGDLVFADGRYRVRSPLLLTDGAVSLWASAGELEILGERLRYVPPASRRAGDPRAGYLFLAGIVLLTVVLLRLARRQRRGLHP